MSMISRVSQGVIAGLLAGVFLVSACATPLAPVLPPLPPAPPPPAPPPPPPAPPPAERFAEAFVGGSRVLPADFNTEEYGVIDEPGFVGVTSAPLSTFSIDVDTAGYSNVRRFLRDGSMPPADAVRIEELINYFDYNYPHPEAGMPFAIVTEMADAPWAPTHELVHIGLRSTPVATADLPPNNLVFLLDVSGSMSDADKLPLLKEAFALLVEQLRPQDQVAIVVYAGAAGVVLSHASGAQKATILDTLARLEARGSTAGGAGIYLAYELAREHFIEAGNNRVILATDGDFNVGVSSDGELVELIEQEREAGVYLTVLGFGTGNLQDAKMEQLADHGNGNYAYIDSLFEARRVLVEQMGATLLTVANDVKLQVEFNPGQVKGYRLIGYENRRLRNEEFNDDTRDGGDLGAGHSVTALYEIIPAGSEEPVPGADPLRYQQLAPGSEVDVNEVLTVKVRYKRPGESESRLLARTLANSPSGGEGPSAAFRFASAVAEFGLLLRDSPYKGDASYERAYERAREALGDDEDGRRSELLSLIRTADNPVRVEVGERVRASIQRSHGPLSSPEGNGCLEQLGVLALQTYIRPGAWDGTCNSDYYIHGEYARYFGFELDRDARLTVDLTSPSVDTWLALWNETGLLEEDDDGGDATNARIARVLLPGTYTIEATTLRGGVTGPFTRLVQLWNGD